MKWWIDVVIARLVYIDIIVWRDTVNYFGVKLLCPAFNFFDSFSDLHNCSFWNGIMEWFQSSFPFFQIIFTSIISCLILIFCLWNYFFLLRISSNPSYHNYLGLWLPLDIFHVMKWTEKHTLMYLHFWQAIIPHHRLFFPRVSDFAHLKTPPSITPSLVNTLPRVESICSSLHHEPL